MLVIGMLPNIVVLQLIEITALSRNSDEAECIPELLFKFNSYWCVFEVLCFSLNPLVYFWHLEITNKFIKEKLMDRIRHAIGLPKGKIVPEVNTAHKTTDRN